MGKLSKFLKRAKKKVKKALGLKARSKAASEMSSDEGLPPPEKIVDTMRQAGEGTVEYKTFENQNKNL